MKENIDVAEMKEEIKGELEEEDFLDAVLGEWMELNHENKVELAQRKISVHQPIISGHNRLDIPLLQKGFSALGLKEELIFPLTGEKGIDSLRHISGRKTMSKLKGDKNGGRLNSESDI